jgi:lactoylglutathione lyase
VTGASIVHVMIRVLDFGRSKKFYAVLGMGEIDRYEFPDFRVCYLGGETGTQIEMIENIGRVEPYLHGEGFGNIAVVVSDAAACHRALSAIGAETRPIKEMVYDGRLFARYFHAFDPDGYRVEVLERTGRWAKSRPDHSWLSKNVNRME